MRFTDKASVGAIKETKEGYLVATARVARTGTQIYLARELGDFAIAAGFAPDSQVRVYRSPEEVFHKDSLASITRVPVTIDHPGEDVSAANWASLSVGDVGDAYATEPEWVVVNPMIKDAAAVQAARTTHRQISMGYEAQVVKARDGIDADFEVKAIRYNHLALVPSARAGDQARIGDSWGAAPIDDSQPGDMPKKTEGKEGHMSDSMKTVVLGDCAVSVALGDVAAIEQYKTDMAQALKDAEAKHATMLTEKDEQIGKLKADLVKAQDAANIDVDALVAARADLLGKIKTIDASIDTAGKSDAELRKAAVAAKLGDAMVKDASDAEITGMFKAIATTATSTSQVADAFKSGVVSVGDASKNMQDAWAKSNADMNAWRYQ